MRVIVYAVVLALALYPLWGPDDPTREARDRALLDLWLGRRR